MKISKLILLFVIFPFITHSTCICICKTPTTIYVAADSKRLITVSGEGKNFNLIQNICKIHCVGDIYFAISGHDDGGIYDAAMCSLKKNKNLDFIIKEFSDSIVRLLKKDFALEREIDNKTYNYYLKNIGCGQVSFFGFKNKVPFLKTIQFMLKENNGIEITYQIYSDLSSVTLGFHDHIDLLSDEEKSKFSPHKGESFVYYFEKYIQLEISKHPNEVGNPIDLLELSANGAKWIRKNKYSAKGYLRPASY